MIAATPTLAEIAMRRVLQRIVWVAAMSAVASCGSSTSPRTPVLKTITVSLSPATIAVGQSSTATATGKDQFGGPIATPTINWTSVTPGVASVNGAGIVQGINPGQSNISANVGGVTGSATITVTAK
jgi:hypothetical protein